MKFSYEIREDERGAFAAVTGCEGAFEELVIPEELGGLPVRVIGQRSFYGMEMLTHVILPNTVESIESHSFFRCGIERLLLPESVREIGSHAFQNCKNLSKVAFNEGLERLGEKSFAGTALVKVVLPASTIYMHRTAFQDSGINYLNDQAVTFAPGSDHLIRDGMLMQKLEDGLKVCALLFDFQVIDIPQGVTHIANRAFLQARKLVEVHCPDTLVFLGDNAFSTCELLVRVDLPDSLEYIGSEAFWETSLASVHIGPKVSHIGKNAFSTLAFGKSRGADMHDLCHIEADPSNEWFYTDGPLLIRRGQDGDSVVCCAQNDGAACVTVPEGIVNLESLAFAYTFIREVHLPSTLKAVGSMAFRCVHGLSLITCYVRPHEGGELQQMTLRFPSYEMRPHLFLGSTRVSSGSASLRLSANFIRLNRVLVMADHGFVNVRELDDWIGSESDAWSFCIMVTARLKSPLPINEHFKEGIRKTVMRQAPFAAATVAKMDDETLVRDLFDLDLLTPETVDAYRQAAETENQTKLVALLLDCSGKMKESGSAPDFSL